MNEDSLIIYNRPAMKCALKTFALYSPDELDVAFKEISEEKYDGIEVDPGAAENIERINALSRESGLSIACIMSGFLNDLNSLNTAKRAIDLCNKLKVNITTFLSPMRNTCSWQKFVEYTQDLCTLADKKDVIPTLHNHAGTLVETLEDTEKIIRDTGINNLGVCFDTAHAALFSDPVEWVERLGERIKYVHVKDLVKNRDDLNIERSQLVLGSKYYLSIAVMFTDLGEGIIDFKQIFDALKKNEYKGWLSVEIETQRVSRIRHLKKNLNFLKIYL
jgi:inosose dehydratase